MEEKIRLTKLLLHEEVYWTQRAKVFWLTEGDDNTKFFHASATIWRRINHIIILVNDDGVRVEGDEVMCNVVNRYFSGAFTGHLCNNPKFLQLLLLLFKYFA